MMASAALQAVTVENGALLAALVAVVTSAISAYSTHRAKQADLTVSERAVLMETAEKLREGLVARIEQLEGSESRLVGRVSLLEGRIRQLEDENVELRLRLRTAGLPVDPPRWHEGGGAS